MDLEVKLKKIDQLQQNVINIRRNSFELDDADATELTDLEEELEQCDVRLEDLEGIIEKVDTSELCKDKPIYYLPHQVVEKEGRVTTSTRIVFDATSHQANELSLNDCLWQGPNLYPNLLDVLINFRLNKIAISSDIRQAFLQICVADKHKDAVRFLWTPSDPRTEKRPVLEVYRFNRVIFGVNASPFLLAVTVKHRINKYEEEYPITVKHLDSYMYVDDWITGQDNREEALLISRHAKNIMKEAGM
ncbi:uncharacterized protein LOC129959424 [Argiope bruennichi]|uniref:uncharacterized protein LOC129959424 n=1 Tax=Argiope bruennichi TaxID=94029 RepID=UPI002495592F|nr:uncharacterized protein LOC129959424 [Argiope bruennichi]